MKIQAQVHLAPICLVTGLTSSQFPIYYFPHLLFPWISRSPLNLYRLEEVQCGAKCLLLYLPCLVVPGKCKLAAYSGRETSMAPMTSLFLAHLPVAGSKLTQAKHWKSGCLFLPIFSESWVNVFIFIMASFTLGNDRIPLFPCLRCWNHSPQPID